MADIKKLIEATIEKKPLDIKEMINEIMTEKVRGVITETVHGFEYADELTEEEELTAFFEEFHAEYGHLTEEEQLAIMEEISEEVELEEACCSKCDCDPCKCGGQESPGKMAKKVKESGKPDGKSGGSSGAGMSPSLMAKAVSANPSQDSVTKEEFFAAFHEDYGHLPLDEQEAIMAEAIADLDEGRDPGFLRRFARSIAGKDPNADVPVKTPRTFRGLSDKEMRRAGFEPRVDKGSE